LAATRSKWVGGPLDFGHWSAHKLEQLDEKSTQSWRGRGNRHCARHPLFGLVRRLAAGEDDRVVDLLQRLGFDLCMTSCDSATRGIAVVLKGLAISGNISVVS